MQEADETPVLMEEKDQATTTLEKLEEEIPAIIQTPEPKAKSPVVQKIKSPVVQKVQSPVAEKMLEDDKENVPVSELKELEKALFREEVPEEESSSDCSESEITSSDSVIFLETNAIFQSSFRRLIFQQ
jgi:hypothetical protein